MATTVGSHSVSTFATPVNGGPLDANVVRGNDNTIRSAYVAHDADTGIHVQSSTLASRPSAGTAGRKWITADTGVYKLWYDDGTTWHEVGAATIDVYVLAGEALVKGDVVKVTGYNLGNSAPVVQKVSSATDVAFGIVTSATIANGAVGYITNTGLVQDVNTSSFAIGDKLYPNTSGGLTTTKPTSGEYQVVAYVLRVNSNNGVIYVEFSAPRYVERSNNEPSTVVLRDASGNFSAGTITAGALTSTGLVTFASLKGTGATTVTNILDEDTMSSDSATALATQQSIKAYVDAKVATVDTLAEVLANGNTTGANNIIVTAGQKITTNTIDETTSGSGVTIDSVLLKDDVVNATDIETGTISANDGTTSATIANSTGVMTIPSSVLTTTDINGGTVDGVTIGGASAGAGTFTNLTASGTVNLTGATVSNGGSVTTIDINGGTIDGTTIGGASAAAGTFTTINATTINATTFDMTNLEVTNIKAKDGTASMTVADTTGDVTVSAALVANGNVTLGNATSDTITVGGSFPTGTKLRTDSGVGNTLAVSAYDVDGTTYVDLVTATASNTPTLALTSTGVGSMNNIAIGGSTPAAGAFTTLDASGDFAIATNKFTVASASGNTAVAGTLTTEGTLTSNGNTVLGSDATDTITATAQFVTGTQLKSAQSAGNTLALAAYDVDGTAYTSLVTLTAGNTPTLTMTSVGTGSLNNVTIGGSTAAAGTFTNLTAQTDLTIGTDVVLSRGAANRLDLASGDSLNVVSGDYQIAGSSVLNATTLGSGVTASSLTSVGTLTSLTVSGDLTVDTSTLKVDSTNNWVGIGTASPTQKLSIAGSGGTLAGTAAISLWDSNSGASRRWSISNGAGGNAIDLFGKLVFSVASGSSSADPMTGTAVMTLNSSGQVGIGTASPSSLLHIADAGTSASLRLQNTGGTASEWIVQSLSGPTASAVGAAFGIYSLTASAYRLVIDGSGNLGLGVTPSAWASGWKMVETLGGSIGSNGVGSLYVNNNAYWNGSNWIYTATAVAARYAMVGAAHQWHTAASGTAGNTITFTQAMTLDASGNLGLGVTPSSPLHIFSSTASRDVLIESTATGGEPSLSLLGKNSSGTVRSVSLKYDNSDVVRFGTASPIALRFETNDTERARITSGGYFKASNDGTYRNSTGAWHELRQTANVVAAQVDSINASLDTDIFISRATRNTTNNTFYALSYYNDGAAAYKWRVADSGNVTNTNGSYGTISDAKHKTDIVDAGSQWDDLKAVRFRKFKMKDDPSETVMLGVVAQELEQVSPGLIEEHPDTERVEVPVLDEDGNETGEVTVEMRKTGTVTKSVKTSVLLMKAAVALQEAMARIEALEARLEALEA